MQLPTLIRKSKPLRVDPAPEGMFFHEAWAVVLHKEEWGCVRRVGDKRGIV
jgi:hypothetical protein